MDIKKLKRWQWMAVGLAVGLMLAEARQLARSDLGSYGRCIDDQEGFEASLVGKVNGKRLLRNLIVYPEYVDDSKGGTELVYIVAGYHFGTGTRAAGGAADGTWQRVCFIAEVPYRPLSRWGQPIDPKHTVRTYLNSLSEKGVRYQYAWWHETRWARILWIGGSLLAIGLVWPSILNLIVFGALTRPREERVQLTQLRADQGQPQERASTAPVDLEAVERFNAELQEQMAPVTGEVVASQSPPAQPRPTKLSEASAESAPILPPGEEKSFVAEKDDYYPTERRRGAKGPSGTHGQQS